MSTEPPTTLVARAIETIAQAFDPAAWSPTNETQAVTRRDVARTKASAALDNLARELGLTVVRDTTYPKDPDDPSSRTSKRVDGHRLVSDIEPLPDGLRFYDYDDTADGH
jgi:hypothetical protein